MGETPRPPVDSEIAPVPPQESRGAEHRVNSKYVTGERNIPDDPEIVEALTQWADAWGRYLEEDVRQGQPAREQANAQLQALMAVADEKRTVLEQSSLRAKVDFPRGSVSWGKGESYGMLNLRIQS